MSEFEAMPLGRCVAAVRAWAEAPWPLTPEQGRAICADLGWVEDSEKPYFYYTGLDNSAKRDAAFTVIYEEVWSAVFQLTTRVSPEDTQSHGQAVLELTNALTDALTKVYGNPQRGLTESGKKTVDWRLSNGVVIGYAANTTVLMVAIDSPAKTALLADPRADPNPDERL